MKTMAREEVEGGWIVDCDSCEEVEELEQVIDFIVAGEAMIAQELFGLTALMADTPYAEGVAEITLRIAGLLQANAEAAGLEIEEDEND